MRDGFRFALPILRHCVPVARTSGNGEGDSLAVRTVIAAKLGALRVS